ncbi:glutaredoxin family protein [Nocardia wallacei]|uniref:glutaredoxin family protein n=1 Tax=Nocardia wallacei TaxID=480035 RepID=UPI002453A86B|nr:glutaredoxin family protein [Nocardia wallacei]
MPQITVYSRPNCQPCRMTIRQLEKLGAPYVKVDVTEDSEAAERIKALGYLQAPVVVVGDEHWSGFKPQKIAWAAQHVADS